MCVKTKHSHMITVLIEREVTSVIRAKLTCGFIGFSLPVFGSKGDIFVAMMQPFRKHLIAIGCCIHCDIYENFMDSSRFSL